MVTRFKMKKSFLALAFALVFAGSCFAELGDDSNPYTLPETVVADRPAPGMTWWQAAVLGVIEGLTEYLPVSSTGHLLVAQRAMGLDDGMLESPASPEDAARAAEAKQAADAYAICIQAGAILAVLGIYLRQIKRTVLGVLGRDPQGRQLAINLIVAFLPAAIFGVTFNDWIETHLFSTWPIILAWLVGGLIILLVSWSGRDRANGEEESRYDLLDLTWKAALLIGLAQCVAMWPGTSRSLVTIVAGVLVGMRLVSAVEFSFLLGVITLGAATVYKAFFVGPLMLEIYGWPPILIGFITAFLAAAASVFWMLSYLKNHSLAIFGYYRVGIAIIVALLVITELL